MKRRSHSIYRALNEPVRPWPVWLRLVVLAGAGLLALRMCRVL